MRDWIMKANRIVLSTVLVLWMLQTVAFAGTLREELSLKTGAIAQFLKTKNANEVSMAPIQGPSFAGGLGNVGNMLEELLLEHEIHLVPNAEMKIHISLSSDDDFDQPAQGMFMEIEIKKRSGRKLQEFTGEFQVTAGAASKKVKVEKGDLGESTIDHPDDVQHILSVPVAVHDLDKNAEDGDENSKLHRLEKIRESAHDPKGKSFIKQTKVSSTDGHLYQLELYRTSSSKAMPPLTEYEAVPVSFEKDTGFAFAKLDKSDRIAVRVYNNSGERVAADIRLDGISSFHFSKSKNILPFYAVNKSSSSFTQGFFKGYDQATKTSTYNHFKIVDYMDGAWLKAQESTEGGTAQFGTIAVHIHRETDVDRADGQEFAHAVGEGKKFEKKEATTKMKVGQCIETIVIRYQKPIR